MNYRHAYHAGNFADVMKHSLLVRAIEYLKLKEKPFFLLDTHAGAGRTDLSSEAAQKTGEFRDGIARILSENRPLPAFAPYLATLHALGCNANLLQTYPGSPLIARYLARAQDRFAFCELHPEEAAELRSLFRRDEQVKMHEMDGYLALKSMLPPQERRGLVLIDAPFENRDEFNQIFSALQMAIERWPSGTYLIWYPIKDPAVSGTFLERLENDGPAKTLMMELYVRGPGDPSRLSGCGLIAVNPPWTLADDAKSMLNWLADILAQNKGARALIEWLHP